MRLESILEEIDRKNKLLRMRISMLEGELIGLYSFLSNSDLLTEDASIRLKKRIKELEDGYEESFQSVS